MTALADLKLAHRATWAAGDYGAVAEHIDEVPPAHLLGRVPVGPSHAVLDVAAGTGNAAIRAALAGAEVVGLDLTPELLEVARRRASAAGVAVDWVEGDAEDLPFEDASFDAVLSIFGVQFAPRHQATADELARVCRPGGRVGLINWTPAGFIGQLFRVMGRYMPAPPAYASAPPLWGDEAHVRSLFTDSGLTWQFARGHNPWRFSSAEAFIAFFETAYGPPLQARVRLTAEGTWDACRRDLVALAEQFDEGRDGALLVRAEYLVAVGVKSI
jgi:SAM-dependent methyltransferase